MNSFAGLNSKEDFYTALRENREREPGRAKAAIAEEITDAAEAFGDRSVVVSALVEQMSAYHGSGEGVKYPVTFARLLKLWDEAPEDFDDYERHRVFWYFKWVTSSLLDTPEVPLPAIRGWITEMQRRYQAADEGAQPVYAQKYFLATHTGEDEDLAYELWATRGRTRLSDCAACEARARAGHWIGKGEDERGLAEMEPTFTGRVTCAEEPHTSQSLALLPLVRLGRLDEARTAHLTGYRAVRGKEADITPVGRHLEFCALTGNEARGLELLAQNRNLFGYKGSAYHRLWFLTGVEVLLKRLAEAGHGELPCAGPVGREWTVATLRAALTAEADALAARFDARNGSTRVSGERRERLGQPVSVTEQLNLGVRSGGLQEPETPETAGSAGQAASGLSAAISMAATAVPATAVPDDFAELLDLARFLDKQAHPDARRLWRVVAERAAGPDAPRVDDLVRGELAFERGYRAHRDDDWMAARREFLEASQWYAKAGRQARTLSSEGRAIWAEATAAGPATSAGRPIEAAAAAWPRLTELINELSELRAAGFPDAEPAEDAEMQHLVLRQCRLLVARNAALRSAEHPDREHWIETFHQEGDLLIEEGTAFGVPLRVTLVHELRAEFLGATGDPEGSEREARTAIRIFTENGMPWRLHRPRMMVALSMASRGRFAEAAGELQTAIVESHPATEADEITPLHRVLGDVCSQSGEFATAVRAYSEAAVRLDRAGEAADAVQTRWRMSKAMMAQGATADAVAVLETLADTALPGVGGEAVGSDPASQDTAAPPDAAEPTHNLQLLTQIRVDLGQGLLELGEPRAAAVEFLRVADTVGAWPEKSRLAFVAAKAALALALADNWDAARAALGRALDANRMDRCLPELSDTLRELASAAMRARGADACTEGLGYLDQADALRAEFPDAAREQFVSVEYDAAQVAYVRGKVLLTASRAEEALASFETAIAGYDGSGHPATSDRFEAVRMAAITELNHLDRAAAAHARLDRAVAEAEAAGHRQAAEILGRLREVRR